MATLPDYTAISGAGPTPDVATAAYEPPNWRQVGMAGQTIAAAGNDLENAAQTIAQTNERQDSIVAQAAANNLAQQRMTQEFDPQTGFRNAKEGQAVGQQFVDTYTKRFDDSAQQIRDSLQNDDQRRVFDQHAQAQSLSFKSALLQHQSTQTEAFNDSTADNTVSLSLRSMAQRPTDELNFQTNLAAINATIDSSGVRKGLPDAAIAETKAKYFDAAYSTRILSILDGVPGAVQSNPYLAEKMFEQVQDQLGPAAQVTLGQTVQKGIKQVQARDIAQGLVFGGKPPLSPSAVLPGITGAPLDAIVKGMESSGNRYDSSGRLLQGPVTSSGDRAQGEMQVMPGTAANPGFGVIPARDNSPEELARVGHDYLGAMVARYQDPALAMAAYNAGPGQVDKWLVSYGDPRSGQISDADWASKIPFAETQKYVTAGLQKVGAQTGQATYSPPTATELKTQLPAYAERARQVWEQMYPNDPVGADGAAARVMTYGNMVVANQTAQQDGARDQLTRGMVGTKPDGTDKPQTIDALLSDPSMKAAWNQATPEVQLAIQTHFKNGDVPRTAQTQAMMYKMEGQYSNNREQFAAADLAPLIPLLPFEDFNKLASLQVAARNKQELAQDKAINLQHALSIANDYALKPIGIPVPDKNTPQVKRDAYDQFTGALREQLDQFQTQNKRTPTDQEIATMAKNLTTTVQVPGTLWGTHDIRAFQITPENQGQVTTVVPPDFRAGITQAITKAAGKPPTEAQVQTAYLLSLRQAPRVAPRAGP